MYDTAGTSYAPHHRNTSSIKYAHSANNVTQSHCCPMRPRTRFGGVFMMDGENDRTTTNDNNNNINSNNNHKKKGKKSRTASLISQYLTIPTRTAPVMILRALRGIQGVIIREVGGHVDTPGSATTACTSAYLVRGMNQIIHIPGILIVDCSMLSSRLHISLLILRVCSYVCLLSRVRIEYGVRIVCSNV